MLDTIIPKIKGFLFNPGETFRNSRTDETRAVVFYFSVLLLFLAGLYAALQFVPLFFVYLLSTASASAHTMSSGTSEYTLAMVFIVPLAAFVGVLIMVSLLMLIFSLWTHLWVYLLGGRNGFFQTLHAILYSMTPNLLLGWIPLVGMVASIWSLILMFFGIRELQELDDGRTIGVILLAVFLPIVILVILLILAIMAMASAGGSFPH